jgi:fatty acid/phospholipid biosynthesis enzyme
MSKVGEPLRIAVDIMGGDYATQEIIKGAVTAAAKADAKIILVGTSRYPQKGARQMSQF